MTDNRYPTVNRRDDSIYLSTWPGAKAASIPGLDRQVEIARLRPNQPCRHPGCLHHVTHPCEGCGRIAGRWPEETGPSDEEPEIPKPWILVSSGNFKEDESDNMDDVTCQICGEPIPEDDPDYFDHETMGPVHDSCLAEYEADEPNRAADFYHDSRF